MAKHYAANEQETNRQTIQTMVDWQALRELYLLPFEVWIGRSSSPADLTKAGIFRH